MEGVTFRPTARQVAVVFIATAPPMAGGLYALTRSAWYSGGVVWTGAAGVLLLAGLSTVTDRTRLDADGISVRRFLFYRFFVPWALVDTVREVKPRLHPRGRAIAISTLIGQRIVLPTPVHVPALPDSRFPDNVEALLTFVRSATPGNRGGLPRPKYDTTVVTRRNLAPRITASSLPHAVRAIAARGVPQAILAFAALAGATASLISLHHSVNDAARFKAAPPCTAAWTPPPDSSDPWCVADRMAVAGLLSDADDGPYGFALVQAPDHPVTTVDIEQSPGSWVQVFVTLGPGAPILDKVTANDIVYDVVLKGQTAGAVTYFGQRLQTTDSPLLAEIDHTEGACTVVGPAAFCLLLLLRGRRPHSAAVRAGLAGFGTFTFVAVVIAGAQLHNPGITLLPFFALTVGCARLLWVDYPFAAPCPADEVSTVLWARDDLVRMS